MKKDKRGKYVNDLRMYPDLSNNELEVLIGMLNSKTDIESIVNIKLQHTYFYRTRGLGAFY
jgi:hypothetical protein